MTSERFSAIAFDYGGTLATGPIDHLLGQRPVDLEVTGALRTLYQTGVRLLLASNSLPSETRWPALQKAEVDGYFSAAVLSYPLGLAKPDPAFYDVVIAAAQCPAERVLFVGDHLVNDVQAPIDRGMSAVLVRPKGRRRDERLPEGAWMVKDVAALPALLQRLAP